MCVDDNPLVGDALRRRIEHDPVLAWAGLVSDGPDIMERVLALRPDVVLMDIDMPGVDTFSLVESITAAAPDARVVMLSGHVNRAYIDRALDGGAWGYLSKNDDVARLIDSIKSVARGEVAFSQEVHAVRRHGIG